MSVRIASAADAPAIVRTLSRAFADDPFVRWLIRKDAPAEVSIRRYMELALHRLTLPHRAVYTTDACEGAALWAPPGTWDLSLGDQLSLLPAVVRVVGLGRLVAVASALSEVEARRPPRPWWFLALLGTDPDVRGRGLGSSVLAPVLERCDREGVAAVLDTCVERNVRFYERHGFRVTAETPLPSGPPCWSMMRPGSRSLAC